MYGPRATQVARILDALIPLGWHSTVVCLDPRRSGPNWRDGRGAQVSSDITLLRVPSPEEWMIVRAAWRLAPALRDFPDSKWVWIGRAARAAQRASARTKFDGLITFAQPWSDHLIGLRVHRATGLPWVAHFSDPWVDSPYDSSTSWQQSVSRRLEADVIREASAVVFVTMETADLVMAKYPSEWRNKVAVVPHGFDARATPQTSGLRRAGGSGPMRVVYTGRFYRGVRTPVTLLQALARVHAHEPLENVVEFTFVGPFVTEFSNNAKALGLESFVHFRERVPPEEAAAIAANADVLLAIDAPSEGASPFLPSKLIDYLPLRKPIFGITPAVGASAGLLRRLGCDVAPPENVDAIASTIVDLISRWKAGTLGVGPSFDCAASEFDIRRTSACLNGVLIRAFDQVQSN